MSESFLDGKVSIYALCEADSGTARYIGKTIGKPSRRLIYHIQQAKRADLPVHRWIREQLAAGARPKAVTLELCGDDWKERECYWIARYRASNSRPMLNVTAGGQGQHGRKIAGTRQAEIVGAKLRRGAVFSCEHCGTSFYRKRKEIVKGDCRFCSRPCYYVWQKGKTKIMPKRGVVR